MGPYVLRDRGCCKEKIASIAGIYIIRTAAKFEKSAQSLHGWHTSYIYCVYSMAVQLGAIRLWLAADAAHVLKGHARAGVVHAQCAQQWHGEALCPCTPWWLHSGVILRDLQAPHKPAR